jgi:LmbE family N-acetylglucosaminyl deacetylase
MSARGGGVDGSAEALPAAERVVALSPHPDDVAFSAAGVVTALAEVAPVAVVTVFTGNVWAPNLPADERTPERVSPLREREDAAYCRAAGCERLGLGFDDAGLRGYDDLSERLEARPEDAAVAARVAEVLAPLLRPCTTLLCPLALGEHVDHRIVRDAVLGPARRLGLPVLFYEDLPYARHLEEAEIDAGRRRVAPEAGAVVVPLSGAAWERKVRQVSLYRSQLRPEDLDDLEAHARRTAGGAGRAERVWYEAGRAGGAQAGAAADSREA